MDDYLLPNEQQMKLMAEEYAKIKAFKPPIAEKNFDYPLPVYLNKSAEEVVIDSNSIIGLLEGLKGYNFGKINKTQIEIIKQIIGKNSILIANLYRMVIDKKQPIVVDNGVKSNALELLNLLSNCLCKLYTMRAHTDSNLFDRIISDHMVANSLLQNMLL